MCLIWINARLNGLHGSAYSPSSSVEEAQFYKNKICLIKRKEIAAAFYFR